MERGAGQLKQRFHVLHSEVRVKPEETCRVILACELLCNICKVRNIGLPNEDKDFSNPEEGEHAEGKTTYT